MHDGVAVDHRLEGVRADALASSWTRAGLMHELMKWVGAVPTLVGLGLALGMSPALYGATADTLARGSHIRSRLTWLLSGLVAGATVLVVVLRGLDPAHFVAQVRSRGDALVEDRMVDLTAGVMLLVAMLVA